MLIGTHYMQQRDTNTLIIQKDIIHRQQQQLNSYFMNQKDAVILFKTIPN